MNRAALLLALACAPAAAFDILPRDPIPEVVGLHLVSKHASVSNAPGSLGWNERNYGLYARWDNGLTVGAYRNSLYRDSFYAGYTFETSEWNRLTAGLTVGVVTGYDRLTSGPGDRTVIRCAATCRPVNVEDVVAPLLVPSLSLRLNSGWSVRGAVMKAPGAPAAAHLMLERRRDFL